MFFYKFIFWLKKLEFILKKRKFVINFQIFINKTKFWQPKVETWFYKSKFVFKKVEYFNKLWINNNKIWPKKSFKNATNHHQSSRKLQSSSFSVKIPFDSFPVDNLQFKWQKSDPLLVSSVIFLPNNSRDKELKNIFFIPQKWADKLILMTFFPFFFVYR